MEQVTIPSPARLMLERWKESVSQQLAGEVTSALPDCVLCRGTGEICSVVGDGRSHWVEITPCRCQVKIPSCDPVKITD